MKAFKVVCNLKAFSALLRKVALKWFLYFDKFQIENAKIHKTEVKLLKIIKIEIDC